MMSEQGSAEAPTLIFNEIKTGERGQAYKYKSPRIRANAVLILGILSCVTSIAQIAALMNQWRLLQKMGDHLFQSRQEMMSAATASDQVVRSMAILFLIVLILTYIAGGLWIYRAACNVRAAGARGLKNSPGWAIGWYFVPLMCLFRPFGAMVEIWNGSLSPERWKTLPTPGLLRLWWGLWLATNAFGWAENALRKAADTIPTLIFLTQFGMADSVLDIASTAIFLVVVLQITRMQAEGSASANELAAAFN